ncbi:hypothetical protein RG903_00835 [Thermithiobacillus tepidarius DSM 3134]|uniref:hypothetical protein n=1 Tax=Thermithiobacillus tepidarius TaxID=929 RepID=UPI000426DF6C|nr:hypothetical protein [Thermithiobacillus tepidarius]
MRYHGITLGMILAALAAPASALDFQPSLGVEQANISGTVQTDAETTVDLKSDLGLDKSNPVVAGFRIGAGKHSFSFRYVPYSFSGDSTISRSITFNGRTFGVNERLHSEVDLKEYAADYRYKLLRTPVAYASLGLGLNVFDARIDIRSQSGLNNAQEELTAPIPTLGASAGVSLPLTGLSVNGDLSGIGYGGNRYINADANVDYSPLPFVGIKAGYRYRELKFDVSDTKADIRLKGPYVAAYVGF